MESFEINSFQTFENNSSDILLIITSEDNTSINFTYHDDSLEDILIANIYYSENNMENIILLLTKHFNKQSEIINPKKIEVIFVKDGVFYHITVFISTVGGKLHGINILDNDRRKKVYDYIYVNQGVYFRQIMRKHDFTPHLTKYHLTTLEDHNYIRSMHIGRYLVYFPSNIKLDIRKTKIKILLQNKNIKNILKIISLNQGINPTNIAKKTKLHRNTINYNIKKLLDLNVIKKNKNKWSSENILR